MPASDSAAAAAAVEASLEAANAARAQALAKVTPPSWLPAFLSFDLDADGVPDVLERELWTGALDGVIWAILTFAAPNTVAYKIATKLAEARQRAPTK